MKEAYTRVCFEPLLYKKKSAKKETVFPQFRDLLAGSDLCRKASFVKQAESEPDLHKAFVFCILLISNLQLNLRELSVRRQSYPRIKISPDVLYFMAAGPLNPYFPFPQFL